MISPPVSLYIHFPWCVKKCPYCDFNSHPLGSTFDESSYVSALLADLEFELRQIDIDQPLISIFMGGGTPSLFSAKQLMRLLGSIQSKIEFHPDIEITMEANPGTTEHQDFGGYREAGINRLSLGVQSFDTKQLDTLGRIHSTEDTLAAFQQARTGGFENINIDLMFGLPDQKVCQAVTDLDAALSLVPEHISLYQLTLEPNTFFYRYPPALPEHEKLYAMQLQLQQHLKLAGYDQYEVSAYSQSDKQCQHNLNYWQYGDYIGIGAGAHGKITTPNDIVRRARKKHPATYQKLAGQSTALATNESVDPQQYLFEFLMNGLRLKEGVTLSLAEQRTGLSANTIQATLRKPIKSGLLVLHNDTLRCSERGYLFLDEILQQIL